MPIVQGIIQSEIPTKLAGVTYENGNDELFESSSDEDDEDEAGRPAAPALVPAAATVATSATVATVAAPAASKSAHPGAQSAKETETKDTVATETISETNDSPETKTETKEQTQSSADQKPQDVPQIVVESSETETPVRKPLITTESKDRLINRVQVAPKSKQELKAQEKKLQETKMKNDQVRSRLKKQDPNRLPFDFQRFLGYLKSKSADSIVKYLKSFLIAFSKKNWSVEEQIKLITDFKNFIYDKMSSCAPFNKMNQTEFINCQEGMEKLIMNRLYDQVFSPVIHENKLDVSHREDIKKDEFLKNQILRFTWVKPVHLDLDSDFIENGSSFIELANNELIKINNYRSPRDKIICILNCCKVIFAMLKNSSKETNADYFIPTLIFIVLKTNEDLRLNSNISYIERFRNEDGLSGEVSYYLSSFWAVIGFIENLNKDSFTISQEEWDSHMKAFEETSEVELHDLELERQIQERMEQKQQSRNANSGDKTPERMLPIPEANGSPSSFHIFSPLQSISQFFNGEDDKEKPASKNSLGLKLGGMFDGPGTAGTTESSSGLGIGPASGTGNIKQQTLVAPHQDSHILTTPAIMNWNKQKLEQTQQPEVPKPSKAVALAQKAFDEDVNQLCEQLSGMFPNLGSDVIRDVVVQNKARVAVCADVCLQLSEQEASGDKP